ncbi:MAG: DUF4252 domain-containing protein [Bacteroidales bacterium]|nr:DUF4252 domain-containing protein [Bacteroidales bacterium]
MKKIYAIIAAIVLAVPAFAQGGKDLYNKYSDLPGVSAVYISPAMFRLIGRIPDVELADEDVNFTPIIKSMNGFYLLSTEDVATGDKLYGEVSRGLNKSKYELLMEAKEDGEVMRLFSVGDDKTVTSLLMLAKDGSETTFLSIDGQMDRSKLEEVIASAAAD